MLSSEDLDHRVFRIKVHGPPGVGKTTFISTMVDPKKHSDSKYSAKNINKNAIQFQTGYYKIKLFFDENLNNMENGHHAVLLLYSLSNEKSYLEFEKYYNMIRVISKEVPIYVIATSLNQKIIVSKESLSYIQRRYEVKCWDFSDQSQKDLEEILLTVAEGLMNDALSNTFNINEENDTLGLSDMKKMDHKCKNHPELIGSFLHKSNEKSGFYCSFCTRTQEVEEKMYIQTFLNKFINKSVQIQTRKDQEQKLFDEATSMLICKDDYMCKFTEVVESRKANLDLVIDQLILSISAEINTIRDNIKARYDSDLSKIDEIFSMVDDHFVGAYSRKCDIDLIKINDFKNKIKSAENINSFEELLKETKIKLKEMYEIQALQLDASLVKTMKRVISFAEINMNNKFEEKFAFYMGVILEDVSGILSLKMEKDFYHPLVEVVSKLPKKIK